LRNEGIARELINRIQNLRKDKGFEVTDKIEVFVQQHRDITDAIVSNNDYICSETLATRLDYAEVVEARKGLRLSSLRIYKLMF
jgi:isoleucyl-tRNA synthetase